MVIKTEYFGLNYPITENSFEKLNAFAENAYKEINKLEKEKIPLLFICRGSSGSVLATLVANIFHNNGWKIRIHYVKKEIEKYHSSGFLNLFEFTSFKIIIIDDFISSGETMLEIKKNIKEKIEHCDYLIVDDKGERMGKDEFFKTIITG